MKNTNNVNPCSSPSSSSYKLSHSILDPNPPLIDDDGNLINDISKAMDITTYRNGTIADGVSKLILVVDSNKELQFSIKGTKPDDLTNRTLSYLNQTNVDNLRSTIKVSLEDIGNVRSVVVAVVYTHLQTHLTKTKEAIGLLTLTYQIQIILMPGHFMNFQ